MSAANTIKQAQVAAGSGEALRLLRTVFGYDRFRGAQEEIVGHVHGGGDALVLMPTGGGKSLCYQLPSLLRAGVGIVVSPLIALMQDQVDALLQAGVKAAFLNSSQDYATAADTERRLLRGELDLLYVAPERLLTERFLGQLDHLYEQRRVALFAIDEAHCVSQWGHDFRPEYIQLSILHERFPAVPRIALTATADTLTREEIVRRLGLAEARTFVASFDRPNIRYTIVERDNPRKQLLAFLADHRGEAGIVYCLSRKKVDETALWLQSQGVAALPYHAGLDAGMRREHQQRFVRDEAVVMVATIAFGMGIDKPDVRFVAHLDLPKSLEAYYQETGRAGRDGEPAEAWMTYGLNDVVIHRQRIDESVAPDEQKRIERGKLDAMLAYCEAAGCRRTVLLNYFGETTAACGNCDTCQTPPELWDGTTAAQKFMSAALRTGQRFGAAHLIDILRGKATDKVAQFGHDKLPTFGVGADLDDATWRSVARQLLAGSLLYADAQSYGALKLTENAKPVLKAETTLMLRRQALAKKKTAKPKAVFPADLPAADAGRVDALRQWRGQAAREQGVPAYVILHDRTLHELAARRPQTGAELLDVAGIGQAKAERYGAALLELLRE
ncbi:MAG: DNA helicase RecQ [Rhodocyclaceae bacterium]|nr:DNA helicase RecQ [Rhodocyclaceae bacterium]